MQHTNITSDESKQDATLIPYLPDSLDFTDLDPKSLLLLSAAELELLNQLELSKGRNSKKKLGLPYSILKIDNQRFALYKGARHKKHAGKGAFGKVKYAQNLSTGAWWAVKLFQKTHHGHHEYNIYQALNIPAFGYKRTDSKTSQYELIIPLAHGKLLEEMHLNEAETMDMMLSLCQAVHRLHELGYIHGDLKPNNIFYEQTTRITTLIDLDIVIAGSTQSAYGTAFYMAPEVKKARFWHEQIAYRSEIDIYSLGSTFDDLRDEGNITIKNKNLLDLYTQMQYRTPSKRPDFLQVINTLESERHKYFQSSNTARKILWLDIQNFYTINFDTSHLELKNFDEICLIDSRKQITDISHYAATCHLLRKSGARVHPSVLRYDPENLFTDLNSYLRAYEKKMQAPEGSYSGTFTVLKIQETIAKLRLMIESQGFDELSEFLKTLGETTSDFNQFFIPELLVAQSCIFNNTSKKAFSALIEKINSSTATYSEIYQLLNGLHNKAMTESNFFKLENKMDPIFNEFLSFIIVNFNNPLCQQNYCFSC